MESLSLDLGELTDLIGLVLEDISDQEWRQLRVMSPQLAQRYGTALLRLNHRSFKILQLLQITEE